MSKRSIKEYPPLSQSAIEEVLDKVFIPAAKGVSSTIISLPGFGKSAITRYLIDNFGSLWGKDIQDHLWIQIDCEKILDTEDLISQVKYGLTSRFEGAKIEEFDRTKQFIKDSTWNNKLKVTLVIDNTHLLTVANELNREVIKLLVELYELNVTAINFIFISTIDVPNLQLKNLGRLARQLTSNLFYLQALDSESLKVIFEKEEYFTQVSFKDDFRSAASDCANGDPSILRLLIKKAQMSSSFVKDFVKLVTTKQKYELTGVEVINERYSNLIDSISIEECDLLLKGSEIPADSLLVKSGFLKDRSVPEGSFFSHFVNTYMKTFLINRKESQLNLVQFQLTPQQREIFEYLKSNSTKIVSREEIAKYIWGDLWSVKYSDWAIDKQISAIRKYCEGLGYSVNVIRGKGIRLSQ